MRSIDWVLEHSEQALLESERVEVSLGWRVRLWDAMKRTFPEDALERRAILAYRVASGTLPAWEAVRDRVRPDLRDLPHDLLATGRALIQGRVSLKEGQFAREM